MAQSIQGYLHGLPSEQKRIAAALMALIRQAAPSASAAVTGDLIVFDLKGPVCFIRSEPACVVFGFCRGAELDSAKGRLEADGAGAARIRLVAEGDVRKGPFLVWIKEAFRLNVSRPLPKR
ncbi:MAG: hypothetical protein KGJ84_08220 [Elusimicrobia bacterium]|nr:hypothetical protein [Elusimicrobiota bacterium]